MRVYLAGPMTGLSMDQAAAWREAVASDLQAVGCEVYSPLRGKFYMALSSIIHDDYREEVLGNDKAIVSRDRWDVQRADVIVMNLLNGQDVASIGSMIELGWADAARKISIVVMGTKNVHDHAFVRAIASYIVPSLEDAVDLIVTLQKLGGGA